jgi:hypothetical protein
MAARKRKAAQTKVTIARAMAANSSTQTLVYETQASTEHPADLNSVFTRARYYARESSFLTRFLPLKRSVLNYGFKLKPAPNKGKKPTPQDTEKLNAWLDEPTSVAFEDYTDPSTRETIGVEVNATNREMVAKFAEDIWNEFILLDNAVALWLDGQQFAAVLPPEKCEFTDVLGVPILKYTHGLSQQQIALLPSDQQQRFLGKSVITIDPKQGEHFKVLKRARMGDGFGWPAVYSIFRLLGEVESKEIGMNAMGYCFRKVTRHHKLGHEIKSGDRAGKPTHFWNQQRSDATKKLWVNVVGVDDFTSNFDHTVEFPWPNMEYFDETCWKGSNLRLNDWAGPLAQMLAAKGVMPYLAPALKAQCLEDRRIVGGFLNIVVNLAYAPPMPVMVGWSNLIFNDARLQSELLKFAALQGWASAQTGQEETGLNPEEEEERKLVEAQDKDAKAKYTPIWDPAHGISPALGESSAAGGAKGAAPGAGNGHPAGTPNAQ